MLIDKIKELAAAKLRVAELEQTLASQLNQELAGLPATFGFESSDAFIQAVLAAGGGSGKRAARRGRPPGSKAKAAAPAPKRRKRAKITDETRAELKKLVGAGKTGNEIAKALGISLPSVANIKKQLGLTKAKVAKKK
jgi:DNA-binding CsgD family transcriptional regulator